MFSKEIGILLLIVNKFEAVLFIFSLFSFFEISFKINFNFFSKNNVKKILNNILLIKIQLAILILNYFLLKNMFYPFEFYFPFFHS